MKNKQNAMTAGINREKEPYIAPKMEAEILRGDIVLISNIPTNLDLDADGVAQDWSSKEWTSESGKKSNADW